ncbi:hypothetical protein [Marivirga arenosa]|jgi:hypothetical protein|uniref:Uncharacterized protein n=1 Tax=Marivirga arenosa TaxID=3059076 RepID=A0AA51ZXE7_9BACT|nr:hypothetical protein [Marivirga sp. BKB1-2]WNB18524.1 hypothetical protein QYS47_30465 [Marivirga sp. BKB1-2]
MKIFKKTNRKKNISEFNGVLLDSDQAAKMSGGFKEYKPEIYQSYKFKRRKAMLSDLFGAGDENI